MKTNALLQPNPKHIIEDSGKYGRNWGTLVSFLGKQRLVNNLYTRLLAV